MSDLTLFDLIRRAADQFSLHNSPIDEPDREEHRFVGIEKDADGRLLAATCAQAEKISVEEIGRRNWDLTAVKARQLRMLAKHKPIFWS
jgi:hypothetical protein